MMRSGPHLPQLEKALAQKQRHNKAIKVNKERKKERKKLSFKKKRARSFLTHLLEKWK